MHIHDTNCPCGEDHPMVTPEEMKKAEELTARFLKIIRNESARGCTARIIMASVAYTLQSMLDAVPDDGGREKFIEYYGEVLAKLLVQIREGH